VPPAAGGMTVRGVRASAMPLEGSSGREWLGTTRPRRESVQRQTVRNQIDADDYNLSVLIAPCARLTGIAAQSRTAVDRPACGPASRGRHRG